MSDYKVLQAFKNDLHHYSLEQLRFKPEEGVWSIGQVYDHLIVVAHEYLDNMENCAASNAEQTHGKTPFGERLFLDGGFPPIKIRLPDEWNAPPNNSYSQEELIDRMEELIQIWNRLKVDNFNSTNKVEHGGFGWLNAREWHDLVGMHFRHHVRQIEELKSSLRGVR